MNSGSLRVNGSYLVYLDLCGLGAGEFSWMSMNIQLYGKLVLRCIQVLMEDLDKCLRPYNGFEGIEWH